MNPAPESEARVRQLFRQHVPEIANGTVEIVAVAQVPGRTLVAVRSHDPGINPVRACGGPQAARMKQMTAAAGGGFFSVSTWQDSPEEFISLNFMMAEVVIDSPRRQATVKIKKLARKVSPGCGPSAVPEILAKMHADNAAMVAQITGWNIQLMIVDAGEEPGWRRPAPQPRAE